MPALRVQIPQVLQRTVQKQGGDIQTCAELRKALAAQTGWVRLFPRSGRILGEDLDNLLANEKSNYYFVISFDTAENRRWSKLWG